VPRLRGRSIEFSPALPPEKQKAYAETLTGVGLKVFVEVAGNLGNIFLASADDRAIDTAFTYRASQNSTLLVGFGVDHRALDVDDAESAQRALRAFVPDIEVVSTAGHDWVSDPHTKATYCGYRPDQLERFHGTVRLPEGRVFFASSDHGDGWRGFIDGAIGSGARTARQVSEQLARDST